ncbi:MAG: flagellar hook-length control protein FliK [Phycisphaerales bacterium]|nr:MAG: flagellar hook-length control protein FliK [Phycisphaerales bacterium]
MLNATLLSNLQSIAPAQGIAPDASARAIGPRTGPLADAQSKGGATKTSREQSFAGTLERASGKARGRTDEAQRNTDQAQPVRTEAQGASDTPSNKPTERDAASGKGGDAAEASTADNAAATVAPDEARSASAEGRGGSEAAPQQPANHGADDADTPHNVRSALTGPERGSHATHTQPGEAAGDARFAAAATGPAGAPATPGAPGTSAPGASDAASARADRGAPVTLTPGADAQTQSPDAKGEQPGGRGVDEASSAATRSRNTRDTEAHVARSTAAEVDQAQAAARTHGVRAAEAPVIDQSTPALAALAPRVDHSSAEAAPQQAAGGETQVRDQITDNGARERRDDGSRRRDAERAVLAAQRADAKAEGATRLSAEPAPSPAATHAPDRGAPGAQAQTAQIKAPFAQTLRQETTEQAFEASVSRGLGAAVRQRGGTITMQLQPETLGTLRIRMEIDRGVVNARFEASSAQARDLLTKNIETLRTSLEARGLNVERITVQLAPPQTNTQGQGAQAGNQHAAGEQARQGQQDAADGQSRGAFDQRQEADDRGDGRDRHGAGRGRAEPSLFADAFGTADARVERLRLSLDATA